MGRSSETFRLFAALYPPPAAAQAMAAEAGKLWTDPHRLTPPDQIHLTLQFIGDTPARGVRDLLESLTAAATGTHHFELKPLNIVTLPHQGDPRLVAVQTDAPRALIELHARTSQRLASRSRARDRQRFLPHLTLARFDHQSRVESSCLPVVMPAFTVDRIRLMRSVLTSSGARHEEVGQIVLAATPH
jgi:2'-5' RNA ligase